MKTLFSTFLFFSLAFGSFAHESYPERSDWDVTSKVKDSTLKQDRTRITFMFSGVDLVSGSQRLVWSANKFIDTTYISMESSITKVFISGNYNFKFYVNNKYREIIIPKLKLDSGYAITVQLNFKSTERQNMMVKKPVIYLYPEVSTLVNVQVKPKGKLFFTYPKYDEQGWYVEANSNGELAIDGNKLNYLFWEAEQQFEQEQFDLASGFIVGKSETISFLEEKLSSFGLNSKEQADFITFWGPQLMKNEQNFVHFVFNENCDQFAELSITPKPENTYRIYLLFSDMKDGKVTEFKPQEIPEMNRNGFTVIEWGGSEINISNVNL